MHAFRGQWNVEELFRRAKKGGIAPWGPSFQDADGSLRLHTLATVLGLMLVSIVRIALGTDESVRKMMESLAEIRATLVRTTTGGMGRRPTVALAPAFERGPGDAANDRQLVVVVVSEPQGRDRLDGLQDSRLAKLVTGVAVDAEAAGEVPTEVRFGHPGGTAVLRIFVQLVLSGVSG